MIASTANIGAITGIVAGGTPLIPLKFERNANNEAEQGFRVYPGNRDENIEEYGPVYKAIERALWVLAPVLIFFLALTYSSMKAGRQDAAIQMDIVIATENADYCTKWGMASGTPEHLDCVRDLVAIRARSEQRVRDEAASDF